MTTVIDSHCHLDHPEFETDRDEVVQRALDAGLSHLVTIGAADGFDSAVRARELCKTYPAVWASVGIHPHDAATDYDIERLEKLSNHEKVVAIGETGLDFFRDWSPVDRQEEWFRLQIQLAKKLKKPLIIHSRDAGNQCLAILRELHAEEVGGVFHCYSEDALFAEKLHDINFLVSFPGTATFKKSHAVREAIANIPLSQIMIETDSPFMAPEPHRGKRCEPSFVIETAKAISQTKGVTFEEVAQTTTATALKFFKIKS